MRTLVQAIVLAMILFLYGYSLSTVGHNHFKHHSNLHSGHVNQEDPNH